MQQQMKNTTFERIGNVEVRTSENLSALNNAIQTSLISHANGNMSLLEATIKRFKNCNMSTLHDRY